MISISLFVMLLATYAYSVPVAVNDNLSKQNLQVTTSQAAIMHLLDDGETTVVPTHGQGSFTTGRNGLRITTQRSPVNNERAPREMLESLEAANVEMAERGVQESSTLYPSTFESSSQSGFRPRGMVESSTIESSSQSGFHPRGMVESSTFESSSQSGLHPRGMVESSTLFPTTVETTSESDLRPRGMEESSTLVPSMLETSTEFNQRGIRGQNVQYGQVLQTTEVPTSSVSSFAQTTGLFRPQRGEHEEEHDSSSLSTDEATTDVLPAHQRKTSIEIIPGRNTKTEIIPGPNTKTEIIPGPNTKTEIVSGGSNSKQGLSQGKN